MDSGDSSGSQLCPLGTPAGAQEPPPSNERWGVQRGGAWGPWKNGWPPKTISGLMGFCVIFDVIFIGFDLIL